MAFFPASWLVEGLAAIEAGVLAIHQRFTFHTAVLHPDLPGRLPTTSTTPSAFSSVRRGLVKFGLLVAIMPSATSRSPISSAVIPPGSPLVSTFRIIALRLEHFGLTLWYASLRSFSSMFIEIIPFYPTNAGLCRSLRWILYQPVFAPPPPASAFKARATVDPS